MEGVGGIEGTDGGLGIRGLGGARSGDGGFKKVGAGVLGVGVWGAGD